MLFFNVDTLTSQAAGDNLKFIALLNYHFTKRLPKSSSSKYKPSKVSLAGSSYLLNPKQILDNTYVDSGYVVQYIKLAALRDYAAYRMYKDASLDISYFPDLNIDVIQRNPLLKLTKTHIHFKYEK